MLKYTVIIEKGRESGYVAFCPVLKGCVAQGKTKQEAIKNLKKAMKDYIECLIEDGYPVPTELGKEMIKLVVAAV
jgi:predicted RNase H-like HicB family nuclease